MPWNKVPDPKQHFMALSDDECEIEMRKLGIEIDRDAYRVIRPTIQGSFNATKRYDKDPTLDLDPQVFTEAFNRMYSHYAPHFDTCERMVEEKMEWNFDSSPGHFFKYERGLKKTKEIFENKDYIDDMRLFDKQPAYPTLWTACCKEELLPMQKIIDNKPRTFIIPDKREHYHAQRLLGEQHELFARLSQSPHYVQSAGYAFQHGGFSNLMKLFSRYPFIMTGDLKEYDASEKWSIFLNVIIPIRTALYKPPVRRPDGTEYTVDERRIDREKYRQELFDLYYDMVHSCVVLPNGQVIWKHGGMNSGFFGTSDDNTLFHEFMTYVMEVIRQTSRGLWKLMSDDCFTGLISRDLEDFAFRQKVYGMFGMTLKPETDKFSDSPEGHSFLGFTAHWDENWKCYVPVFDTKRLASSLIRPSCRVTPARRFLKVNAARILAYFTKDRDRYARLAYHFYADGVKAQLLEDPVCMSDPDFEALSTPWTDREVAALWLGNECELSRGVGLLKILSILENDEDKIAETTSQTAEETEQEETGPSQAQEGPGEETC